MNVRTAVSSVCTISFVTMNTCTTNIPHQKSWLNQGINLIAKARGCSFHIVSYRALIWSLVSGRYTPPIFLALTLRGGDVQIQECNKDTNIHIAPTTARAMQCSSCGRGYSSPGAMTSPLTPQPFLLAASSAFPASTTESASFAIYRYASLLGLRTAYHFGLKCKDRSSVNINTTRSLLFHPE